MNPLCGKEGESKDTKVNLLCGENKETKVNPLCGKEGESKETKVKPLCGKEGESKETKVNPLCGKEGESKDTLVNPLCGKEGESKETKVNSLCGKEGNEMKLTNQIVEYLIHGQGTEKLNYTSQVLRQDFVSTRENSNKIHDFDGSKDHTFLNHCYLVWISWGSFSTFIPRNL
ncbi:hypothetical protein H6P81_019590 [Aristolochia fimbriata]|uniref:Uncharacterized protein n=1 Tax=Aristolochia fimbriata TaxID=158543 RepID=A0AAV7DS40_ARIFI|nr:hypothetical protein H6P81_019590 [Aristolochia fimbriata]